MVSKSPTTTTIPDWSPPQVSLEAGTVVTVTYFGDQATLCRYVQHYLQLYLDKEVGHLFLTPVTMTPGRGSLTCTFPKLTPMATRRVETGLEAGIRSTTVVSGTRFQLDHFCACLAQIMTSPALSSLPPYAAWATTLSIGSICVSNSRYYILDVDACTNGAVGPAGRHTVFGTPMPIPTFPMHPHLSIDGDVEWIFLTLSLQWHFVQPEVYADGAGPCLYLVDMARKVDSRFDGHVADPIVQWVVRVELLRYGSFQDGPGAQECGELARQLDRAQARRGSPKPIAKRIVSTRAHIRNSLAALTCHEVDADTAGLNYAWITTKRQNLFLPLVRRLIRSLRLLNR